ncbi:hypothetical protein FA95DRAFT_1561673 [Auriscalpium vulgare]|uniref:Uncharacterized protein n=1 Tax=Auriscalpium vulgare TaxID=40419 RepID=A0ACB8RLB6_9AGAM|nr:hypothetical protein FA95DRAFT_1561673 [Auriscalpium vulgare]
MVAAAITYTASRKCLTWLKQAQSPKLDLLLFVPSLQALRMSQYYPPQPAQYPVTEYASSPVYANYPAQQYSPPPSLRLVIPHHSSRYPQRHQRGNSQQYPPSSFATADQSLSNYAQARFAHQLPQPPLHAGYPPPTAAHGHVLPAPSPQYPPQLPDPGGSPPATHFSPTSPTAFRRPLPTPGVTSHPPSAYFDRSPLPTPGPTPAPASPPSRRHPPTSPSSVGSASGRPRTPSTHSAVLPASPTSPGGRRPLPNPVPRINHAPQFDERVRSSSPVKEAIKAFSAMQGPPAAPSATESRPSSPTKFVPYWKRNLPAPNPDRATIGTTPQGWNAGVMAGSSSSPEGTQRRDRSQSVTSARPLPLSPTQAPDISMLSLGSASSGATPSVISDRPSAHHPDTSTSASNGGARARSPTKSDISNGHMSSPKRLYRSQTEPQPIAGPAGLPSQRAPSPTKSIRRNGTISPTSTDEDSDGPQYGIRDLPARSSSIIDHNNAKHSRTPASIDRGDDTVHRRPNRSATLPHPPLPPPPSQIHHRSTQSVTSRPTAFSPVAGSSRLPPTSTPTSPTGWPTGLPPLPRAPTSPSGSQITSPRHREFVNLDDAPPVSLRRTPSPSPSVASRIAGPSRLPAFTPTAQRSAAASRPPLSPRAHPPSPKKNLASLPHAPSAYSHPVAVNFGVSGLPVTSSRVPSPERRLPSPERQRASQNASPERRRVPPPLHPKSVSRERQPRFVAPESKPQPALPPMAAPVPSLPMIQLDTGGSFADEIANEWRSGPRIDVSGPEVPQISIGPADDGESAGQVVQRPRHEHGSGTPHASSSRPQSHPVVARRGGGLACGGCGGPIVGRIVSAMGTRWHPGCFRCSDCRELLEYVSSYEHDGKPYCHLDYHERFAPRCYHCKTAIVDERFITLDDHELGKRTYHGQHFFCSECGDPFLAPAGPQPAGTRGELTFTGDGEFEDDDVGFTVYKGYPYCESCHVRLRSPKCKGCKKIIRDGTNAVEALGGKWHFQCFTCTVSP